MGVLPELQQKRKRQYGGLFSIAFLQILRIQFSGRKTVVLHSRIGPCGF